MDHLKVAINMPVVSHILSNNQKEIENFAGKVCDAVLELEPQIKNLDKEQQVMILSKLFDKALKLDRKHYKKASCKRGCNQCCHMKTDAMPQEAEVALNWALENNVEIDTEALKEQVKFKEGTDEREWFKMKHKKCVFLKKGECSVYPVRPMSCRRYHVTTPASLCDTTKSNKVASIVSINTELAYSVAMTYYGTNGKVKVGILSHLVHDLMKKKGLL